MQIENNLLNKEISKIQEANKEMMKDHQSLKREKNKTNLEDIFDIMVRRLSKDLCFELKSQITDQLHRRSQRSKRISPVEEAMNNLNINVTLFDLDRFDNEYRITKQSRSNHHTMSTQNLGAAALARRCMSSDVLSTQNNNRRPLVRVDNDHAGEDSQHQSNDGFNGQEDMHDIDATFRAN